MIQTEYGVSRKWYWPFVLCRRERVGRVDVEALANDATPSKLDEAALVIASASKQFDNLLAVSGVSFTASKGEIFALLGPNGAGKTTLLNCVLGLYKLSSGTALINGYDVIHQQHKVYRHIGVCPQHEILWPELTVKEHLLFYSRLKGVPPSAEEAEVGRSLECFELVPERNRLTVQLSGGQKRRLCVAIALVGNPAVAFLDEPTTGLDPNTKRE